MAEESKQSELANEEKSPNRSVGSIAIEDSFTDLEESLDFDVYVDDIPLMTEGSGASDDASTTNFTSHFTDPSSDSPQPIPFNLSSLKESDTSDFDSNNSFTEDDLDDILLRDSSNQDSDDESIALSETELNNITNTSDDLDDSDQFEDKYDTFTDSDEEDITLASDELDQILNPDEDEEEEENDFIGKSFFDSEEESDDDIALSTDELNNITNIEESDSLESEGTENIISDPPADLFEYSDSGDDDIALSGDELNNILESGSSEDEDFSEDSEVKSFFDSDESEGNEEIALSPEELSKITESEYEEEDGIETDDYDPTQIDNKTQIEDDFEEDDSIALSGDELNNILESGEAVVEEEEEFDIDNAKSFFDSDESGEDSEDESISLSPDELGNITAEENYEVEEVDNQNEPSFEAEDNFDLSETPQDLEIDETKSDLFESASEDDGEISLSGDELNNILESGEIESEEVDTSGNSFFDESSSEDESISLSPDELGNITAEENYEVEEVDNQNEPSLKAEDNFDLSESSQDLDMESTPSFLDEETVEDDDIALSGDELNNILETGNLQTEEAEYTNPIDSGMVINDDDFVIDENSSLSNLGDVTIDDTPLSNLDDPSHESFQFGNVKKDELRKVISYMDELLGSLPDSYIKDFASSEYFDLYKKIMNELEL